MTRIALATLCLNESDFIEKSYEQHRDWPGLVSWVFVEAADPKYAEANPGLVSKEGLSIDGTGEIAKWLAHQDTRINLVQHGWMREEKVAQAKTVARDRYLEAFEDIEPDVFIVLDADEFYTYADQQRIYEMIEADEAQKYLCWRLIQRHIWWPPSIRDEPRFGLEVTGGYWAVKHVRIFRWRAGIRYRVDHNYPQSHLYSPLRHLYEGTQSDPHCVHLGFAKRPELRVATNNYYKQRGEGQGDGRQRYVDCRSFWETWKPRERPPRGVWVQRYNGPIPECYQ